MIRAFPHLDLFDRVVAENGALLYTPATREEQPLGEAPPEVFVSALRQADYSRWFRDSIKDDTLADEVARIEEQQADAGTSRAAIRAAIEERYTAPA